VSLLAAVNEGDQSGGWNYLKKRINPEMMKKHKKNQSFRLIWGGEERFSLKVIALEWREEQRSLAPLYRLTFKGGAERKENLSPSPLKTIQRIGQTFRIYRRDRK